MFIYVKSERVCILCIECGFSVATVQSKNKTHFPMKPHFFSVQINET